MRSRLQASIKRPDSPVGLQEASCHSLFGAFTLVELLVVIAVLEVLAALFAPVTSQLKREADVTVCKSNLRQWGIAFALYADDAIEAFPDNSDAWGVQYLGTNAVEFCRNYLVRWAQVTPNMPKNSLFFCPTDRMERGVDLAEALTGTAPVLIGYESLPSRDVLRWRGIYDYSVGGLVGWHSGTKMGREFSDAPTMVDRLEAWESGRPLIPTRCSIGSTDLLRRPTPPTVAATGFLLEETFCLKTGT